MMAHALLWSLVVSMKHQSGAEQERVRVLVVHDMATRDEDGSVAENHPHCVTGRTWLSTG